MTEQFASIELARLYESQGYIDDALAMYRKLIVEDGDVDGVSEAHKAVARLEKNQIGSDSDDEAGQEVADAAAQAVAPVPMLEGVDETGGDSKIETEDEKRIAALLEQWLMLMVVQKRVNGFKAIRARL